MGMPLQKMSMAEFLAWEEHQPERHEFYRGDIFAMVGGSARHNRVILNLAARLGSHFEGTPCQVFAEGMKVELAQGYLYPDVMVTCGKPEAGDEQVIKDPKVIIEVLSPSTRGYDRRDKFILYRELDSLAQYALVDPSERRVEVFTRGDANTWTLVDQSDADQLFLSSVSLTMPMSEVFKGLEGTAP